MLFERSGANCALLKLFNNNTELNNHFKYNNIPGGMKEFMIAFKGPLTYANPTNMPAK